MLLCCCASILLLLLLLVLPCQCQCQCQCQAVPGRTMMPLDTCHDVFPSAAPVLASSIRRASHELGCCFVAWGIRKLHVCSALVRRACRLRSEVPPGLPPRRLVLSARGHMQRKRCKATSLTRDAATTATHSSSSTTRSPPARLRPLSRCIPVCARDM